MVAKIKYILANKSAFIRRYLWPLPRFKREVVVMVDGKMTHGGLTDRFRNILSVYCYCKQKGIRFRVYYVYPCSLTAFLVPNKYDWRISERKLSSHFLDSEELCLYVKATPCGEERNSRQAQEYNNRIHLSLLDRVLTKQKRHQYHLYGNAYFARGQYKSLFEELFQPSELLRNKLSCLQKKFTEPYESVTLRFQMLLGDLYEGHSAALDEQQQEKLLDKCVQKIDSLWQNHFFSTPKILVTSDSSRFLSIIAEKEYVYIIPGKMEHMDYTNNSSIDMNAKPFLDLFMLMKSQRLTQLLTGKMYKSGFPAFAAELGNKPYEEIRF